ncbi:hypothetical protein [Engelhardtia mirabilis]|uniref:Lipoprotein SmpA/OmlA domain-containing protein n=1 Tax=Engelhardtia mirabilis TaxID=2528011 RepID=A0A518BGY2_9BACT|nr:hypothetical protein Pla133_12980 [Planctomycetes bacterium Pla133]QDV00559.1 hypothetical protein Pla86_12980 [Planctomycetes bacterium Pla86]
MIHFRLPHPSTLFVQRLCSFTLCACVLGCISVRGPQFDLEDAKRVELGMTKAEVVEILGSEPSDTAIDATGELWMWIRVVVTPTSSSAKSFSVKFQGDRVVFINR